jgi:hypothetical protein
VREPFARGRRAFVISPGCKLHTFRARAGPRHACSTVGAAIAHFLRTKRVSFLALGASVLATTSSCCLEEAPQLCS